MNVWQVIQITYLVFTVIATIEFAWMICLVKKSLKEDEDDDS